MIMGALPLYEFISVAFPEFREFLTDAPQWYKEEMDYPVARRLLDFVIDLQKRGHVDEVIRLMRRVECGMLQPERISSALCLDFVQPIADLDEYARSALVGVLGPMSRACYESH